MRVLRGAGAVTAWGLGLELGRGLSVPHAQRLGTQSLPPTVRQYADICLFSTAQYKCPVAQVEQE